MKNLENYGVQALNAKEIREVDGGWDWSEVGYKLGYAASTLMTKFVEGHLPWYL